MEADKGKLNIVREAGHFKRTAIMQGEIVSIPNKVNDNKLFQTLLSYALYQLFRRRKSKDLNGNSLGN